MNVLCIGNSFSQDATRYLHRIARADGEDISAVNLYIGGCSLERHYRNMLSERRKYCLEINGHSSGFFVSLKEALLNREWDFISLQQVSHLAVDYDTFEPYLNELSSYVEKCAPKARTIIHQTWAYEEGSKRLCQELGYTSHADMLKDVKASYQKAASDIGADMVIPSGELFSMLIEEKIAPVHRDTFHASYGVGRYALSLLWYRSLTGADVTGNNFSDFDEKVPDEIIEKIKKCVMRI